MRFLRVPGMRWPPQADGVLMPLQWHAFRNDRFWCPVGTVQNRPVLVPSGHRLEPTEPGGETRQARPGRRDISRDSGGKAPFRREFRMQRAGL